MAATPRKSNQAETFSDVHAAFVEFRAKDSDKCLSVQCIYCQSVRAKNTSRQRSHLLECVPYLNAMKEHHPNNPILELATNGTPTASMPKPKKRDHETMSRPHHNPLAQHSVHTSSESFQGDSAAMRGFHVPKPTLERDFQMSLQLNPKIGVGQTIWGDRSWVSYISGHWNGRWGKGSVMPGGQDKQLVAQDLSLHSEANYLLQTHDQPAAFITVRTEGWCVGPRNVLQKLGDPNFETELDPTMYSYRLYIHMETGDNRYLHLNTGMWIGAAMKKGPEIVFDAYRVL